MTNENEKDMVLLTSFVAVGILFIAGITAYIHSWVVLPVAIIGLILIPLLLMENKPKISHITENLEKIVFFIVFFSIVISFISLYVPS